MALKFVVGLFESRGIAEDAVNRLKYESVPATNVFVLLMHETTAGVPAAMTPELAALEVDPFVVGNVRETYAPFIRNGETAVFVRAHTEDEVDVAVATIRLYAPIKIKVVASGEGAPLSHDIL
jgi:hypothetical protein